ncbi:MAG: ABC transporter substrate-binding protein [Anaerolineaceae bacterium]
MSKARWFVLSVSILMVAAILMTACKPAATQAPAVQPPAQQATEAPAEQAATEAPAEAAATEAPVVEEGPQVGGTFVYSSVEEPDTLDIYKSAFAITSSVTSNIGGSLVAKNYDGQMVPFLAKSWEISEDGLTYTFHLRDDVKFHNGEPFTAHDYVWTWDRCLGEDFVCPVSASLLTFTYEATDDYTLVLHLAAPNYYTISNLGAMDYLQPLNQKAVEAAGDTYGMGTTAVGVGPYMIKEWVQDEKIILTRNPDFTWGPEYFEGGNTGPYYVEELEFRILPDLATQLAGLEANELDYGSVEAKDLEIVKNTGYYEVYDLVAPGFTFISFNLRNEKFSDVRVREALNLATDKATLVQVVLNGQGAVLDGPLAEAMIGYDEAAMKGTGAKFDVEAAKALFEEAGFTYGSDGMLIDPEGQPFTINLMTTTEEQSTKLVTMLVDMWKQVGVAVTVEQLEWGTMAPKVFAGEYEACTMGIGWPDADIMYMMFHSSQIGAVNFHFTQDADLDALLDKARNEIDAAAHQEAVNAAYKLVQDQSYIVPMFSAYTFLAVSNDFQGIVQSPFIYLITSDMYYAGN